MYGKKILIIYFDIFVARGGCSIRVWMNLKIVWVGSMGYVTGWESMQHQRVLYFSRGRKSASFYLHKMVFFSPEEGEIWWPSKRSVRSWDFYPCGGPSGV